MAFARAGLSGWPRCDTIVTSQRTGENLILHNRSIFDGVAGRGNGPTDSAGASNGIDSRGVGGPAGDVLGSASVEGRR